MLVKTNQVPPVLLANTNGSGTFSCRSVVQGMTKKILYFGLPKSILDKCDRTIKLQNFNENFSEAHGTFCVLVKKTRAKCESVTFSYAKLPRDFLSDFQLIAGFERSPFRERICMKVPNSTPIRLLRR